MPHAIHSWGIPPFARSLPPWRLGAALSSGPPTEPSGSPFDSCGLAGRTPSSSSSLRQSSVGTVLTSGCTGGGCPPAVTRGVAAPTGLRPPLPPMATPNPPPPPPLPTQILRPGLTLSPPPH